MKEIGLADGKRTSEEITKQTAWPKICKLSAISFKPAHIIL